jgi:hypothetical protein
MQDIGNELKNILVNNKIGKTHPNHLPPQHPLFRQLLRNPFRIPNSVQNRNQGQKIQSRQLHVWISQANLIPKTSSPSKNGSIGSTRTSVYSAEALVIGPTPVRSNLLKVMLLLRNPYLLHQNRRSPVPAQKKTKQSIRVSTAGGLQQLLC